MTEEKMGLLDEAVKAATEAAEAMNVDGWVVEADPSTGEPIQDRLPVDYIMRGVLTKTWSEIKERAIREFVLALAEEGSARLIGRNIDTGTLDQDVRTALRKMTRENYQRRTT